MGNKSVPRQNSSTYRNQLNLSASMRAMMLKLEVAQTAEKEIVWSCHFKCRLSTSKGKICQSLAAWSFLTQLSSAGQRCECRIEGLPPPQTIGNGVPYWPLTLQKWTQIGQGAGTHSSTGRLGIQIQYDPMANRWPGLDSKASNQNAYTCTQM